MPLSVRWYSNRRLSVSMGCFSKMPFSVRRRNLSARTLVAMPKVCSISSKRLKPWKALRSIIKVHSSPNCWSAIATPQWAERFLLRDLAITEVYKYHLPYASNILVLPLFTKLASWAEVIAPLPLQQWPTWPVFTHQMVSYHSPLTLLTTSTVYAC